MFSAQIVEHLRHVCQEMRFKNVSMSGEEHHIECLEHHKALHTLSRNS